MRHSILNGREFDAEHDATRADAAMVNLPLAQALFADGALRQHLLTDTGRRLKIIGVVSDAKYRKMAESVRPTVFVPLSTMYLSGLHLVTRTEGHASRMLPAIAEVVRSIDNPEIDRETTLDLHLQTAVRREQVAMVFVGACSVMILLFALIGPFLLTRHSVRSRQSELAVRVAIGARRKHLFELVMSHAARATLAGILIGEATALAVGASFGYIPGYSIATAIPPSLAIAAILMGSCAVSAALPTVKILRLNPASALR